MPYQGVTSCHQASDPLPETAGLSVLVQTQGAPRTRQGSSVLAASVVHMHRGRSIQHDNMRSLLLSLCACVALYARPCPRACNSHTSTSKGSMHHTSQAGRCQPLVLARKPTCFPTTNNPVPQATSMHTRQHLVLVKRQQQALLASPPIKDTQLSCCNLLMHENGQTKPGFPTQAIAGCPTQPSAQK